MSGITMSCKVDGDGKIIRLRRSSDPNDVPAGWVAVRDPTLYEAIYDRPLAFRYIDEKWAEVKRVRVSCQRPWFYADGQDLMSCSISGATEGTVHVTLNGIHINLDYRDVVEFTADEPGIYTFRLDDDRYYARPDAITIQAVRGTSE